MKIGIIGYGQMGKMIEEVAKNKNIEVAAIIDPKAEGVTHKEISSDSLKDVDVVIDFTHPSVIMDNIKKYCDIKVNAVIGTTGWYDNMDEVKSFVKEAGIGLIWSGNFSIGVNLFFEMIKSAAQIINKVEDYDILGLEYHHNLKADSPSGTMNMIGKILIDNIDRKSKLVYDKLDRKIESDELHLASVRGGSIPGTHEIDFDSKADTITLKHTARSRIGFASGAVLASKFLYEKKGFFEIKDMINELIGGN